MNKRIVMGLLSVGTALTLVGGSAFAAFTTQASATANTFSTGNDNLLISKTGVEGSFTPSVISPFGHLHITPGYTETFTFYLNNDSTNSTDNLDIQASFSGGSGDSVLENVLSTQFSCNDNGTITTASPFSVTSMRGGSVGLGTILSGHMAVCTVTVSLPTSADNSVASKTTTFDVLFNGTEAL